MVQHDVARLIKRPLTFAQQLRVSALSICPHGLAVDGPGDVGGCPLNGIDVPLRHIQRHAETVLLPMLRVLHRQLRVNVMIGRAHVAKHLNDVDFGIRIRGKVAGLPLQPGRREIADLVVRLHADFNPAVGDVILAICPNRARQHARRVVRLTPVRNGAAHQVAILDEHDLLGVAVPTVALIRIARLAAPDFAVGLASVGQIELIAEHQFVVVVAKDDFRFAWRVGHQHKEEGTEKKHFVHHHVMVFGFCKNNLFFLFRQIMCSFFTVFSTLMAIFSP